MNGALLHVNVKLFSKVTYVRERISVRNSLVGHVGTCDFSQLYGMHFGSLNILYDFLNNVLMPMPNSNIQFSNHLISC